MSSNCIFIIDVDDTITFSPKEIKKISDYDLSLPNQTVIDKVNSLYNEGHHIVLYTARGNTLCSTLKEIEEKVRPGLEKWLTEKKVKYHELKFGKISYPETKTYYIGDEVLTIEQFINNDNSTYGKTKSNNLVSDKSKVLILGNGVSRSGIEDFISTWDGEIWVCNKAFTEVVTYKNISLVASIHPEMLKEANEFRKKNNLEYEIISKLVTKSDYKDSSFHVSRGWSTGSLLITEAFERKYKKIYLAGFDMGGKDLYQTHELHGVSFRQQFREIQKLYDTSIVEFVSASCSKTDYDWFEPDLKWPVVPNNSILIVGNGAFLLEQEGGRVIDSHPFVVRINDYETKGYEKYSGSKTDCWITGANRDTQIKGRKIDRVFPLCLMRPDNKNALSDSDFNKRTGLLKKNVSFLPDYIYNKIITAPDIPNPSTGLKAIILFTKLFPDLKIIITGFDFLKEKKHYYKEEVLSENFGKYHLWEKERAYVDDLIKQGRVSLLTAKETPDLLPEKEKIEITKTWPIKPKQPIIILGNSPEVLKSEKGKEIDSFPCVVRLNDFVTKGYEKYIGSKTDIWVTGANLKTILKNRDTTNLFPICSMKPSIKNGLTKELFEQRLGIPEEKFLFFEEGLYEKVCLIKGINNPSTGLKAIQIFLSLFPDNPIYVHGFDFYQNKAHYYKEETPAVQLGKSNEWDKEKEVYTTWVNSDKIKKLSDNVCYRKNLPVKNIFLFGSSLVLKDLDIEEFNTLRKQKDIVTGGVNRIYKLFQPEHYFFMDGVVLGELERDQVEKENSSPWLLPSFIFSNPDMPFDKKEVATYMKKQKIKEINTFNFQEHTKRKSSLLWLIIYLQNVVYKEYNCKFYLYGISLVAKDEDKNYFYDSSFSKNQNKKEVLQTQYNSQLEGYKELLKKGYNLVSITPGSKLNTSMPFIDISLIDFIKGMPDK
jgi:hypothetical protein